ncbi:hypothetical protein BJV74DRAFT_273651 [Russula compacta]|nr:hypothetical protein BJV74DRAFT_273651 [Russula compacta]
MLLNPLRLLFTLALAAAVGVSAQSLDACVLNCAQQAVANSTCTSYTDFSCVCKSASFQATATACLQANCTAQDQATALALQQQECGTSSQSTNGTSKSSSSSSSPTSKSKSGAVTPIEQLPFFTVFVTIVGVALGGTLAL